MSDVQNETPIAPAEDTEGADKKGFLAHLRDGISGLRAWLAGLTRRQRLLAAIVAVVAAIVIALAILIWYLIFRQPISELPGVNLDVPPKYSFSISGVQRPLGVAVDEAHNRLYVTQSDGDRLVKVFDLQGNPLGQLLPPDDGLSHTSTYVAVDRSNGLVYVTDRSANQLYVYDPEGKYLKTLIPDGLKDWGPLGITVGPDGVIYTADANSAPQMVRAFKNDGTVVRQYGATETLSYVNALAVLDDGALAVADSNNTRVLVYNADGTLRGILARGEAVASMGLPRGLAVGAKGRLYIVDTTNDIVRIYKPASDGIPVFSTQFGQIGQMDGQFLYPNGVATDDHGHIYVTDRENNRVQVWQNQ